MGSTHLQTVVVPIMQFDNVKKLTNPFVVIPNESSVVSNNDNGSSRSSRVQLPAVCVAQTKYSMTSGLQVVLEGRGQSNTVPSLKLDSTPVKKAVTDVPLPPVSSNRFSSKPAILPSLGTTQALTINRRPRSAKKYSSEKSGSLVRKSQVTKIPLAGENVECESVSQFDASDEQSQTSCLSSVHELVEEARRIASALDERNPKKQSRKSTQVADAASRKSAIPSSEHRHEDIKPRKSKRTVDEIIATLQDQSDALSESDKKIQDIMDTLIFRTAAVFGNVEVISESSQHVADSTDERLSIPSESDTATGPSSQQNQLTIVHSFSDEEVCGVVDTVGRSSDVCGEEQLIEEALMQLSAISASESRQLELESMEETLPTICSQTSDAAANADYGSAPVNLDQLWHDLNAPATVTNEDLISIVAQPAPLLPRPTLCQMTDDSKEEFEKGTRLEVNSLSLGAWTTSAVVDKSVHHFCILPKGSELPQIYQGIWRPYHTGLKDDVAEELHMNSLENTSLELTQITAVRQTADENTSSQTNTNDSKLEIVAGKLSINERRMNMYWTPAPPKWDIAPSRVKSVLFPHYHGADYVAVNYQEKFVDEQVPVSSSSDDEEDISYEPPRPVRTKFCSAENIVDMVRDEVVLSKVNDVRTVASFGMTDKATQVVKESQSSVLEQQSMERIQSAVTRVLEGSNQFSRLRLRYRSATCESHGQLRRSHSAPGGLDMDDDFLLIYQDFRSIFSEISSQQKQLEAQSTHNETGLNCDKMEAKVVNEDSPGTDPIVKEAVITSHQVEGDTIKSHNNKHVVKRKKKKKAIKGKKVARTASTFSLFNETSTTLLTARSSPIPVSSVSRMHNGNVARRLSVPNILQFDEYKSSNGYNVTSATNEREWVRDIWNVWFDGVFPPTPRAATEAPVEAVIDGSTTDTPQTVQNDQSVSPVAKLTVYSEDVEMLPAPELQAEEIELLRAEVMRLNKEVSNDGRQCRAYDFCRRGAIQRRLGNIKDAFRDINFAIFLEPNLVDAYWHRHLLNVQLNRQSHAVDDLNMLIHFKKSHVPALKSRALLYAALGESTLAEHSLNMALKYHPDDYDIYLYRAEIYEKAGESLLAMEDYATCSKVNPTNTDSLLKHAIHLFNESNWQLALQDLDNLLEVEPLDANARYYRGRVRAELHQWNGALEDLSAAIHLNPRNAQAFHFRGCLLRNCPDENQTALLALKGQYYSKKENERLIHWLVLHPKKALQDFSVSLLIDNTYSNISSYLKRGMLYSEMAMSYEAIADLECVVKLDPRASSAFVSLGLIYMQQLKNNKRAVRSFTSAIHADPTNSKAHMCRTEAYQRLHDLPNALLDITRVIHLHPQVAQFYVWRGDIVRKMGNLKLASFCIRQLAELSGAVGQDPMQQAIVHNFLKNYDQSIAVLEHAIKDKPTVALLLMLGQTYMKAGKWNSAIVNLNRTIQLIKPDHSNDYSAEMQTSDMPKNIASAKLAKIYYAIGTCQVELGEFIEAHDSFSSALKYNGRHSEAFYWRGITKLKLDNEKGIQDINRSLAIDPNLFQAYLSRAAYYGHLGKYSKAILNCNEAVQLQPKSVRAYLYRGALKYRIRAFRLAICDLDQAVLLDNTCRLAYYNRALCQQATGDLDKALKDYGVVLLLSNGDNDDAGTANTEKTLTLAALINRSLVYIGLDDYHNALHDLLWALKLSPVDKNIHQTTGVCYHKIGRLQDAVNSFTRALRLDRFFTDALIGRGNAFIDFRHDIGYQCARRDYERVLHYDPTCLMARVNLAHCFQVLGRHMQAWHQFTATLAIDQRYVPALEGRAVVNLQMNQIFAAQQDISAAIAVQPTAELLTNRGVIHQFQNDYVNAMRDYQRAISVDSTYSLAYFNAANMYFYNRQFKQAENYYDLSLVYNSRDESAYLNRAITKALLKNSEGALKDFSSAIHLSPYSAHIYFNRANLYASMNMLPEADNDYTRAIELQPDDSIAVMRRADVRGRMGRRDAAVDDYRFAVDLQTRPIHWQSPPATVMTSL